jgi:hypothetical protein
MLSTALPIEIFGKLRLGLSAEQPHELEMVPGSLKIKVFEEPRSPDGGRHLWLTGGTYGTARLRSMRPCVAIGLLLAQNGSQKPQHDTSAKHEADLSRGSAHLSAFDRYR